MPEEVKRGTPVQVVLNEPDLAALDKLSGGRYFRATYLRHLIRFAVENDVRLRLKPDNNWGHGR